MRLVGEKKEALELKVRDAIDRRPHRGPRGSGPRVRRFDFPGEVTAGVVDALEGDFLGGIREAGRRPGASRSRPSEG